MTLDVLFVCSQSVIRHHWAAAELTSALRLILEVKLRRCDVASPSLMVTSRCVRSAIGGRPSHS